MSSHGNNWSIGKITVVSAVAGLVVLLLLLMLFGFAFWGSFFWGLCIAAVVFIILWLNFGAADGSAGGSSAGGHAATGGAASAARADAGAASAASVAGADATPESGAASASDNGASGGTAASAPSGADAAQSGAASPSGSTAVKPSKELPGQAELAARKGDWKYQAESASGDDAGKSGKAGTAEKPAKATKATKSTKAAKPAKSEPAGAADLGEDYDKDGVREGTNEGQKPEMLSAAREGGADNLKEIKGVGPKMEQMLNAMGVYHFDQIAAWTADEVAWVDANLKGFKGRVSRDGWVDQAKILMTGAETEFSQRVEDGKVY